MEHPGLANERTALELDLVPELTTCFEALDLVRVGDDLAVLPVPVPPMVPTTSHLLQATEGSEPPSSPTWAPGPMNWSPTSGDASTFPLNPTTITTS